MFFWFVLWQLLQKSDILTVSLLHCFVSLCVCLFVVVSVVDQAPAGDPLFTVALPALVTGSAFLLSFFAPPSLSLSP